MLRPGIEPFPGADTLLTELSGPVCCKVIDIIKATDDCLDFMFGMMIDSGPKFLCSIILPPHPLYDLKVKVTDLEFCMLKFCVKVFRTSLFPNPMMYLVHVWSCPEFYAVPSPPPTWPYGQGNGLRIFIIKFCVQNFIWYYLEGTHSTWP